MHKCIAAHPTKILGEPWPTRPTHAATPHAYDTQL